MEQVDAEKRCITLVGPEGPSTWTYDLLVGAEGPVSLIRKVLVKSDKKMKSQLSYIGPMRYVTARSLSAEDSTSSDAFKRLTSPSDAVQSPGGGLQANGTDSKTVQTVLLHLRRVASGWTPLQVLNSLCTTSSFLFVHRKASHVL